MMVEGLRGQIRGLIRRPFRSPLEREREFSRRHRDLSAAISRAPQAMSNYVLRGELQLEHGNRAAAKADFEAAVALAEQWDAGKAWHIVEQVSRDRALEGLRQIERRMNVEA